MQYAPIILAALGFALLVPWKAIGKAAFLAAAASYPAVRGAVVWVRSSSHIGAILLGAAAVLWTVNNGMVNLPGPRPPTPAPGPVLPTDLSAAIKNIDLPDRDRQIWGGMLQGLGRFVDADGRAAKPALVTVFDVAKLRDAAVAAPIEPVAGGDRIGAVLGAELSKIGKDGEPLDATRRKAIADLFVGAGRVLADG